MRAVVPLPCEVPVDESSAARRARLAAYRGMHTEVLGYPDAVVEAILFGLEYVSEAALRAELQERHPGTLEFVYR